MAVFGDRSTGLERPGRAPLGRPQRLIARRALPRQLWPDVAIAAAVLLVQTSAAVLLRNHDAGRHLGVSGLALVSVPAVFLLWRRRYPVAVLLATFATTLAYGLGHHPRGPVFFAVIVAFVTAVFARHRVVAWSVLALGYLLFLGPGQSLGQHPPVAAIAGLGAWMLVLGFGSEGAFAAHERHRERQHAAAEESRRRASEERLEIARDLHDVLAHHVALISVQSGVALHLLDDHPEQARPALSAIRDASSEVLRELRGVLELLRAGDAANRQPAPDLRRLDELISNASLAGVEVTTRVDGELASLPDVVSVAGYRIVQEALTNIVRHAGSSAATLTIWRQPGQLRLEIMDNGRGGRNHGAGAGSGILGMRERAAALGGRVEAGPRTPAGFRVAAVLPLEPSSTLS